MPRRELFRALAAGVKEHEQAEYFNLAPEMLEFRLRLLEREAARAAGPAVRGAWPWPSVPAAGGRGWPGQAAGEGGDAEG